MSRIPVLITFPIVVVSLSLAACAPVRTAKSPDPPIAGLYDGDGTWTDSVKALAEAFDWMGYEVRRLDASSFDEVALSDFAILVFPGGDMYQYALDIPASGRESIATFVTNGGSYLGICGGAYFASSEVIWRGSRLPMEPLGLFNGTAQGPIEGLPPYPEYGIIELQLADPHHQVTRLLPDPIWTLYYWGPALIPQPGTDVSVLATSIVGAQPMMVAFQHGEGRVVLVATHPEIEEDDNRDNTQFASELDDNGSDWELLRQAVLWADQ